MDTGNAYPHAGTVADPLVGQDIRDEVDRAITANPTWQAPGLSTMYFVYLGHNIIECMKGNGDTFGCFAGTDVNGNSPPAKNGPPNTVPGAGTYCAYHSSFGAGPRIYATMPYASDGQCYGSPTSFPNGVDQDIVLSPTSHEQFEAYSNPQMKGWFNDATGNENGDNCAYTYGQVEPDGCNIVLHGHRYQLQREWSNFLPDACIKRLGPASQPTITGNLNFGTVPRGTQVSREIIIQDTAGGDLNLLNVRLSVGASSAFSIDPLSPLWATIPPADGLTIQLNFSPSASASSAGPLSASLIIDTDEPGYESQSLPISGSIGLPKAVLTPASLNFGIVCPGTFRDQTITVNNAGGAPLTISSVGFSAGTSAGLSIPGHSFPIKVAEGAQIAITVRFTASGSPGPISGNVVVTTDDPANPTQSVPLTGAVGAPSAIVTGSTDLGTICAGTVGEKLISVCNVGNCDLHVSSAGFNPACTDFSVVNNPFPATISPGACLDLTIRLTPTSCGAKSCNLRIVSDDPNMPVINLAVTASTPCASIDVPPDLGFGPAVIQSTGPCSLALPFPISNKGQCNLTITSISLGGINAGDFRLSGLPSFPIVLQPGHVVGEGNFNVVFAPTAVARARTATISVTYVSDAIAGTTTTITRSLCGEGVYTGARVLVMQGGVPLAQVEKIHLQRIGGNRNKPILDTTDLYQNASLTTVAPTSPCGPFQYHREYGTVSNPIQLLPGSYQITVTAIVNGKHKNIAVGFDVSTCDFNSTIVVNF